MKESLDELGLKYGTDKSSILHNYLIEYEKYLSKLENVEKVIEIGLQRGGKWRNEFTMPSLQMWQEYFPEATFYGFDLKSLKSPNNKIKFFKGDQSDMDNMITFLNLVGDDIDLIIDDGSHKPSHQLFAFLLLFPKMKSKGVYIVEDCNAKVQNRYKKEEQIHLIIEPYLDNLEYCWVTSNNAGEKSSLVIIKD